MSRIEKRIRNLERKAGAGQERTVFCTTLHGAGEPVGWRPQNVGGALAVYRAIYDPEELEPGDLPPGELQREANDGND